MFLLAPGINFTFGIKYKIGFFLILLSIPFTAITGISGALLNFKNKFFLVGCGTLIFNIWVIVFIIFGSYSEDNLFYLSIGVFVGSIVRWFSQFLLILNTNVFRNFKFVLPDTLIFKNFYFAFLSSSILVLVPVVTRTIYSFLEKAT